jgi:hypothetical protein
MYDTPDGSFPSVTTILGIVGKPALVAWSANVEREMVIVESGKLYHDLQGVEEMNSVLWATTMADRLGKERAHQRALTKAGEIGKQVHALIEWTLKADLLVAAGPSPRVNAAAQIAFSAWMQWKTSVKLKPIAIEQKVWSKHHGFAGTLDLLALVNGRETVVDWKTGKAVYPEAHLQNAAYRSAMREMGLGDPAAGLIVRLPKVETDPGFEIIEAGKMPNGTKMSELELLEVFLNAKKLWDYIEIMDTYDKKQVETVSA